MSTEPQATPDAVESAAQQPAAAETVAPAGATAAPTEAEVAPATTAEATETIEATQIAETTGRAEPQNPLTKKFTDAEWTALKDFRIQLTDIYKEAYPDRPADKTATTIHLWGVDIDTKDPLSSGARASVVLMKFLRARNLSITDARTMLVATLRWRDEFNIEAAMKEEFPHDVFGRLGIIFGKDKDGRPVTYNLYGANKDTKAIFGDVQRFLRWRVALMEKSLKLCDFETIDQTVQIHDYAGVSILAGRDANAKNAAAETSSTFNSHYPELLYKKFFVNAPAIMNWMFWLFKPLLPAATLAKMTVVGSGASTIGRALLPVIDAKELPERYGGEVETEW